jgi:nucleoside-diphosphate-sugar epimerase
MIQGGLMATVAVTGGSGKLGTAAVAELLEHGWQVVNLDRVAPAVAQGAFTRIELGDYGQVLDALSGVESRHAGIDAVVHLAAVPAPGLIPDAATFAGNITATYNVFTAARRLGIRNIVWASSETVLGLPFDEPPPYLPVDEAYPARPNSQYSLAKHLEEQLAAQLCRWDPRLKMYGLRFSNVKRVDEYADFPSFDADPQLRRWNLWGYIDARDGAQAIRLALEHDGTGREIFIVANADTVMSRPSAELAAEVFPEVEVRGELAGTTTLLSIDKARRVLGYEPRHSWRREVS